MYPLALSIKYCKLQAGASRLFAFCVVWKGAGESLLHASASLPSAPSNFRMAFIVPVTFPSPSQRPHGLHLLLFIDLQNLATRSNEMYLFFRQRILPLVQSITHSGRFTSHGLSARGTHLACSMGALYQLIRVHKGGGVPASASPSHALFSFSTQIWAYFYKLSAAPLVNCTLPNDLTLNSTHCFYTCTSSILTLLATVDLTHLTLLGLLFIISSHWFGRFSLVSTELSEPTNNCPLPCPCPLLDTTVRLSLATPCSSYKKTDRDSADLQNKKIYPDGSYIHRWASLTQNLTS